MFPISITLTPIEQKIAKGIAILRHKNDRKANVQCRKVGKQDAWETDIQGIGAEIAFSRAMNVYPDLSTKPRGGGYDCMVGEKKVDVKCTKYKTGRLISPHFTDPTNMLEDYTQNLSSSFILVLSKEQKKLPTPLGSRWHYLVMCLDLLSEGFSKSKKKNSKRKWHTCRRCLSPDKSLPCFLPM